MPTAKQVAEYFLKIQSEDDCITNLKLQKLLYYAQGFHLAFEDEPLFSERIEAWQYGPVVPEIYRAYSAHGRSVLPIPEEIDAEALTDRQKEILNEVYRVFGQYSGGRLIDVTHSEPPWKNASIMEEITLDALKEYFVTQIEQG